MGSHRGVAAVDEQQRAGHVRGVVRGEKQDAGGDFIGRAVTLEQRALGGVIPVLLERPAERLNALLVVERVIPDVPVRQWVLSVPWSLRYQLAFDAALCTEVLAVFMRVIFAWLIATAKRQGIREAQCGAITVIQRFGCRRSYCDLLHE